MRQVLLAKNLGSFFASKRYYLNLLDLVSTIGHFSLSYQGQSITPKANRVALTARLSPRLELSASAGLGVAWHETGLIHAWISFHFTLGPIGETETKRALGRSAWQNVLVGAGPRASQREPCPCWCTIDIGVREQGQARGPAPTNPPNGRTNKPLYGTHWLFAATQAFGKIGQVFVKMCPVLSGIVRSA